MVAKPLSYVENVGMDRFLMAIALIFLVLQPFSASARDLETVVLDPGHGGYDFGLGVGGQREKDVALSIAKKLKGFLRDEGKQVYLTREVDRYLSFADRREEIDMRFPDVFLSIHLSDSESAVVYVTWYKKMEADLSLEEYYSLDSRQRRYLYESRVLAHTIGDAIGGEFGINVLYGELPLSLLRATGAPAILVELPARGVKYDEHTQQRFATSLAIGFQLYGQ
jgi:N-acetylmuramoyl-L-alanine amidase